MISDLQESDTWKIQLTIAINFVSSKDTEKGRVMHWKSDNIKSTSYNDANKVIDELFESLISRYQGNTNINGRKWSIIFDSNPMMHNKF